MKNRVQLLAVALTTFGFYASAKGISVPQTGFITKDTTMYLTADLKDKGGIVDLVDSNTKKIVGITNFDGNRLAKGRYLVIDSVRVLVDTTTSGTLAGSTYKNDAPAAVKASHLVIIQDEEIFNIPVSDLFNDNSATGNDNDFREISHLPILEADKEFKIQWVFPQSGGPGSGVCFAKVEFRATEVFVK